MGLNVLKSMEKRSGNSELSVISQVPTVEECPLSGVPLCIIVFRISTIIIIMFHQGTYNVPNHVQISRYCNVDL